MLCCGCRYLVATAGVLSSSATNAAAARRGYGLLLRTKFRGRSRSSLAVAAARPFWVTLERAGIADSDDSLWKSGVFNAEVHPDLPPAWTIAELLRYYLRRAKETMLDANENGGTGSRSGGDGGGHEAATATVASTPSSGNDGHLCQEGEGRGSYLVRTVPVQISRKKDLRQRLAAAAGVDSNGAALKGCRPANALLLVSGSHPGRRLPLMRRFLPDVYDELRLATSMRDSGHLPERLAFWAVANPMTEADEAGVERARRKVELGAEVIVTQPPLVWESFERWLRGVRATGALAEGATLTNIGDDSAGERPVKMPQWASGPGAATSRGERGRAAVLVGLPMITSPQGLRFWLHLCGVGNNPGICEKAFEAFENTPSTAAQPPEPRKAEGESGPAADPSLRRDVGRGPRSAPPGSEKTEASPYGQAWIETIMSKLQCLDDGDRGLRVAGAHVMAPGAGPRRRAGELASKGVFGPPPRGEGGRE